MLINYFPLLKQYAMKINCDTIVAWNETLIQYK